MLKQEVTLFGKEGGAWEETLIESAVFILFYSNGIKIYKMNLKLSWRGLETRDWDYKLVGKLVHCGDKSGES